jgi:Leucine-rich repeat (LRR) protein
MTHLRILTLNENSFEWLPFDALSKLPVTELLVRKNKLRGTLIEDPIESLPHLQTLDVSSNQLLRIVELGSSISFPVMHALSLSMNRLQGLPDMPTWTSLLTLTVDENNISSIPNSFTSLEKLRHADFSSNDIRVVPPEIARMDNLSMIRLSGNPLRDKKFVSIATDDLKEILASRLEPPPPYQEPGSRQATGDIPVDTKIIESSDVSVGDAKLPIEGQDDDSFDDDFATPPTSVPNSPSRSRAHTNASSRSRGRTLSNQTWTVKSGGLLDRSHTESSTLHPVIASKVAFEHQIKQAQLHHNLFAVFPNALSFFSDTLTSLSLAHNQLMAEDYLSEELELRALRELNLSNNRITSLGPLTKNLRAPALEKIDVSFNRLNALPMDLREAFPSLAILLVSNNHLIELTPESIAGLRIVDATNNDISHLNPKIGLLGGEGGLERLDVMGNRFRVPRFNVLERGTEATLRWLRGRVPVAEMAAWKGDNGDDSLAAEGAWP